MDVSRVFKPLLAPVRYKGAWGGRGSGKSMFFSELMISKAVGDKDGFKGVGIREVQKSIKFSVKELLSDAIKKFGVESLFDIQDQQINCPNGGVIIFAGLQNHTADSIKSLQGFKVFWAEEAQSLSAPSLRKLLPTLRAPGSEFWASWNPEQPTDAIDMLMRHEDVPTDPNFSVVKANWTDNKWWTEELEITRQTDLKRNQADYAHIWEGGYLVRSDSLVFDNWTVEDFDTPDNARFYFGADWGFNDPTVLIRMFVEGRKLYLDYESCKHKCQIDKTPALFDKVPESRDWPIRADNARPETIDYMKRNGFPKMVSSSKGKGSVKDGVEFIRSYDVVIHPRCKMATKEFSLYRYKIDKKTEEVLSELEDDNNHVIDSVRYGLELLRKSIRNSGHTSAFGPKVL